MKKTDLVELILYPSGICNLKCKYCYIVKNKYLQEIDDALAKSFEDENYYLDFIEKLKVYFNVDTMESIALWGAEPSLGYSRVAKLLRKIIDKYPKVNYLMASSNMTTDCLVDGLFDILNSVKETGNEITFGQQISIDGPPYINEVNRGPGTTQKIIDNFDKILSLKDEIPNGTKIKFQFKPTLSIDQIRDMTSKEKIKEYFQFFEDNFYIKINDSLGDKIKHGFACISLVSPSNYTVDDGKAYAEFCRLCRELKESGECEARLSTDFRLNKRCNAYDNNSYDCSGGFCGLGVGNVGLLPNYNLCLCHRTFGSFCENYNQDAYTFKSDFVNNRVFEGQKNFEQSLFGYQNAKNALRIYRDYYFNKTSTFFTSLTNLIRGLASCGQILPKYKDEQTALKAAKTYQKCYGVCAKDCYDLAGTLSSTSLGGLRIMLNGALDEITKGTIYEL